MDDTNYLSLSQTIGRRRGDIYVLGRACSVPAYLSPEGSAFASGCAAAAMAVPASLSKGACSLSSGQLHLPRCKRQRDMAGNSTVMGTDTWTANETTLSALVSYISPAANDETWLETAQWARTLGQSTRQHSQLRSATSPPLQTTRHGWKQHNGHGHLDSQRDNTLSSGQLHLPRCKRQDMAGNSTMGTDTWTVNETTLSALVSYISPAANDETWLETAQWARTLGQSTRQHSQLRSATSPPLQTTTRHDWKQHNGHGHLDSQRDNTLSSGQLHLPRCKRQRDMAGNSTMGTDTWTVNETTLSAPVSYISPAANDKTWLETAQWARTLGQSTRQHSQLRSATSPPLQTTRHGWKQHNGHGHLDSQRDNTLSSGQLHLPRCKRQDMAGNSTMGTDTWTVNETTLSAPVSYISPAANDKTWLETAQWARTLGQSTRQHSQLRSATSPPLQTTRHGWKQHNGHGHLDSQRDNTLSSGQLHLPRCKRQDMAGNSTMGTDTWTVNETTLSALVSYISPAANDETWLETAQWARTLGQSTRQHSQLRSATSPPLQTTTRHDWKQHNGHGHLDSQRDNTLSSGQLHLPRCKRQRDMAGNSTMGTDTWTVNETTLSAPVSYISPAANDETWLETAQWARTLGQSTRQHSQLRSATSPPLQTTRHDWKQHNGHGHLDSQRDNTLSSGQLHLPRCKRQRDMTANSTMGTDTWTVNETTLSAPVSYISPAANDETWLETAQWARTLGQSTRQHSQLWSATSPPLQTTRHGWKQHNGHGHLDSQRDNTLSSGQLHLPRCKRRDMAGNSTMGTDTWTVNETTLSAPVSYISPAANDKTWLETAQWARTLGQSTRQHSQLWSATSPPLQTTTRHGWKQHNGHGHLDSQRDNTLSSGQLHLPRCKRRDMAGNSTMGTDTWTVNETTLSAPVSYISPAANDNETWLETAQWARTLGQSTRQHSQLWSATSPPLQTTTRHGWKQHNGHGHLDSQRDNTLSSGQLHLPRCKRQRDMAGNSTMGTDTWTVNETTLSAPVSYISPAANDET